MKRPTGRIAIRANNLSKRYRIGQREPYRTLREAVATAAHASVKQLSRARRRAPESGARADELWALKDVSFEIQRGEVVGIIGRNGAGKSTLLKIISRITRPTRGGAEIYGRVGSLLEVGTGFHPELTGRENIFLNGAVLGMKKADIRRGFDEIVAFSEVEKFLDMPVKRYSTGLYMRLAFAVAAHLESDILLVDEVLAVGDQAFQKKCLGKMDAVAKQGRTVLFVSHTLQAIRRLCSHCILLDAGHLVEYGDAATVVAHYLSTTAYQARPNQWIALSEASRIGTGVARFVALQYSSLNQDVSHHAFSGGPLEFLLVIASDSARSAGSVAVTIYNEFGTKLVDTDTNAINHSVQLQPGLNLIKIRIEKLHLNPGLYRLGLWLADPISSIRSSGAYDFIETAFEFEVFNLERDRFAVTTGAAVASDYSVVDVTGAPELPGWILS
jgi:lipopolysaccharide transport system ATP-binding protein